jgi:hypothetical protein
MAFTDSAYGASGRSQALAAQPRAGVVSRPAKSGAMPNDDDEDYLSVTELRKQVQDYLYQKQDEIEEQREARRYYHGAQLTAEQLAVLRDRHQPPQVWNRLARTINRTVGLVERLRSDPKALPNKPKSEAGAEIATISIRSVLDANQWKTTDFNALLQGAIDGKTGVQMVLTKGDKGDPAIKLVLVNADEYFYTPSSYLMDFTDVRGEGISKWMDIEDVVDMFPEKEEELRDLMGGGGSDLSSNPDRELKWINTRTKRLRLIEHWYKHKSRWFWCFYVGTELIDQGPSPFFDESGKSVSSFYMFSAAVDHDGDRYGFPRNLRHQQDALNGGKSKTLHLANTNKIRAEKGAVDDVEIARREEARSDGYIEVNPGKGYNVNPDQKQDLATFMAFTEDAKKELDEYANLNMTALTGASLANISGRAIELLRQPGMAELAPFILARRAWLLRIYRGIWNAVQRHWTAERWIRVTGDDDLAQFIQLNGLTFDEWGRPTLVNHLGSLDVDIILEEGPDVASLMADTYDALKGYPPGTFPPQVLIELSTLPRSDKKRIMAMLTPQPQPPDPMQELAKRLSLEQLAAQNADLQADATKKQAEAVRTHAQVEQVAADAAKKRSDVIVNAARAGHIATEAHLKPGEFAVAATKDAREASQPRPSP